MAQAHTSTHSPPKLLSLKEKMALRGKAFKIVARKEGRPLEPPAQPLRERPTIAQVKFDSKSAPAASATSISEGEVLSPSATITVGEASSSMETGLSNRQSMLEPTESAGKRPTIVRLMSPEEASDDPDEHTDSYSNSSTDSESDIPAVRPSSREAHGGRAMRNRAPGSPIVLGGRSRGRGQPAVIRSD